MARFSYQVRRAFCANKMSTISKGETFYRLTALNFSHRDKARKAFWVFKCSCGKKKTLVVNNVRSGNSAHDIEIDYVGLSHSLQNGI